MDVVTCFVSLFLNISVSFHRYAGTSSNFGQPTKTIPRCAGAILPVRTMYRQQESILHIPRLLPRVRVGCMQSGIGEEHLLPFRARLHVPSANESETSPFGACASPSILVASDCSISPFSCSPKEEKDGSESSLS